MGARQTENYNAARARRQLARLGSPVNFRPTSEDRGPADLAEDDQDPRDGDPPEGGSRRLPAGHGEPHREEEHRPEREHVDAAEERPQGLGRGGLVEQQREVRLHHVLGVHVPVPLQAHDGEHDGGRDEAHRHEDPGDDRERPAGSSPRSRRRSGR